MVFGQHQGYKGKTAKIMQIKKTIVLRDYRSRQLIDNDLELSLSQCMKNYSIKL
jgi:hypothetical protein